MRVSAPPVEFIPSPRLNLNPSDEVEEVAAVEEGPMDMIVPVAAVRLLLRLVVVRLLMVLLSCTGFEEVDDDDVREVVVAELVPSLLPRCSFGR
jgi:hypothetical protein